jgi:hypothetical protein
MILLLVLRPAAAYSGRRRARFCCIHYISSIQKKQLISQKIKKSAAFFVKCAAKGRRIGRTGAKCKTLERQTGAKKNCD